MSSSEAVKYLESDEYLNRASRGFHIGPIYTIRDDMFCYEERGWNGVGDGDHGECPMDGYMVFRDDNEDYAEAYVKGELYNYRCDSLERDSDLEFE